MRKWLRRLGFFLGGLVALLGVAYLAIHVIVDFRLARKREVTHEQLAIPSDAATIERGRHLVSSTANCGHCHGADFGGGVMVENFALGRLVAPNITPAGVSKGYSDEDWVRTLRHAVDPRGRQLIVMPSDMFALLAGDDLAAIIAYMKQVPAVERELGPSKIGPLARVLFVAGQIPLLPAEKIDHSATVRTKPPVAPTVEYGRYLAETSGCFHCHGSRLEGAPPPAPGLPARPAVALLPGQGWSEADFVTALRTGKTKDGRTLNEEMPWKFTQHMSDVELQALWALVGSLHQQPVATGSAAPARTSATR